MSVIDLAARLGKKSDDNNSSKTNDVCVTKHHCGKSALAFFLEYDYSKAQYCALLRDCKEKGITIYPSYWQIIQEKKQCKPKNYLVSKDRISVDLQSMLNKSAERLCESVSIDWDEHDLLNLEMSVTLGFDSSSGHLNAQQDYEQSENHNVNASQSLFVSSMIINYWVEKSRVPPILD